ncbi:MAG TPA: oligosaccharide flippase family protein [Flavipsychrobacter sp.]|nr:oligosaccharide flippase family protein [Flavipsychrobacter sp.]
MRGFFARNILFVVLLNLLVKPLWIFMIDNTVQNRVGHDYGSYQALFNLGIIFQILLDFGIANYTSKTIAENPAGIRKLFPALLSARLVLGLLYTGILFLIAFSLGYHGRELHLLAGISVIQLLNSTLLFIRSNIAGLHKFRADGILSISDRLLMVLVCGFLLFNYREQFTIEWFVLAQIVCYALAVLLGVVFLKKIAHAPFTLSLNWKHVLYHVRKSLPYAALIFLMSVYTRSDMLLVERLCGDMGRQEASIYAAGYRLLDFINMIGLMIAGMLLPIFGGMIARRENMQELIRLCVNILLPVSFLVVVLAYYFHQDIMQQLYPSLPATKGWVLFWLMCAFPAFSISNVYSTLLTANGNLKLMIRIALIGVVINLTLNFFLIPGYNAVGAAFAAFVTQTVVALHFLFFAKKELTLKEDVRWVFSFCFYLVLLIFVGFIITHLSFPWILQLLIVLLAGICMIFLMRFMDIASLRKLVKLKK